MTVYPQNPNPIFLEINETISLVEYSFPMSSRQDVAREAARVLYNRSVKEYKDAKDIAAASLGSSSLPSNFEVVTELDRLTDEIEGSDRQTRLIKMRKVAIQVMQDLIEYTPTLIGSVWRGTIREGSDIDIIVYSRDWREVEKKLKSYILTYAEPKEFIEKGLPMRSVHIGLFIEDHPVEIVVRPPEDMEFYRDEKCDTYGDLKKGINLHELERLMSADPLRRFIPKRRNR